MPDFLNDYSPLPHLFVASMLGLIVGIQRGWVKRELEPGFRVAGVRTYTLIALLGALSTWLGELIGFWMLGVAYVSLTIVLVSAYISSQRTKLDMSITSLMASQLTFVFGALAMLEYFTVAAICAVVTTFLLDMKAEMHGLLKKIRDEELDAGLKLLVITLVMLPILPNEGYGPWNALNPYEIWWMVVLVSSISFAGYFAIKIGGATRGVLITGLFAGLSSSTALTLHFSRLARRNPELNRLLAAGILIACATMFPRLWFILYVVNSALAWQLLPILAVMGVFTYIPAFIFWSRQTQVQVAQPSLKQNPLELTSALLFGIILLLILLLSHALRDTFGNQGVYILSALSGLTDVDAISLTLARMSKAADGLTVSAASWGILIAAIANSLVKGGLAWSVGKTGLGGRVLGAMIVVALSGILTVTLVKI
ncbi:MgtC/SapB family protein [Hahella ganghwensis]|uniref:MgtC/SapB family protein n=1 Tax=Hahella ganghwensis TaxID=286420 RepID=UPI0003802473|nr:MgtC/SapB family protein [Hahella ganghwensis]